VVELFDSQNQTSSSVDDCLEPNDAALWQAGKGDIAVINSAQDQTLHQMTSHVLRERPRNRPQLSEDCEAGPHKSRDMLRHCQVPVVDKTEITDLVLRLNSIRTNDKRVADVFVPRTKTR